MLNAAMLAGECDTDEGAASAPSNNPEVQPLASRGASCVGTVKSLGTPNLQIRCLDLKSEPMLVAMESVIAAQPHLTALTDEPACLRANYSLPLLLYGFPVIALL